MKLLDSAQTSFNRFLSGNSEWVRENLKGVQEYFRIMRTLRKEVLEVIEEHQLALRKQNDQEGLVDALDRLLPAIEQALAEEDKNQASSSKAASSRYFLSPSVATPQKISNIIKSGKLSAKEKAQLMKALSEVDDEPQSEGAEFLTQHQ